MHRMMLRGGTQALPAVDGGLVGVHGWTRLVEVPTLTGPAAVEWAACGHLLAAHREPLTGTVIAAQEPTVPVTAEVEKSPGP